MHNMPAYYNYLSYSVLNAVKEKLLNNSLGNGAVDGEDLTLEEIARA